MKILFVCSDIPYPPYNGVRIKSYNVIRLMAEESRVSLIILSRDYNNIEKKHLDHLKELCEEIIVVPLKKRNKLSLAVSCLFREKLFYIERYRDENFRKKLNKFIEKWKPDVVHFDIILMSQYASTIDPRIAKVVSPNDSYALGVDNELRLKQFNSIKQIYKILQFKFTKRYETQVYAKFDYCHVVSEVDKLYLEKLNPAIRIISIPNGVDIDYFKPVENKNVESYNFAIFVADMSGGSSRDLEFFLNKSWKLVIKELPEVKLLAVGRNPSLAVQNTARKVGGVIFKGYVEDLRKCYNESLISITPTLKNCGILNKALESMAMGLAVAGFEESFMGIPEAYHNINCVKSHNYEDLSFEIIKLFSNPPKAISIGKEARKIVENNYFWQTRKEEFYSLYKEAISIHKKLINVKSEYLNPDYSQTKNV